MNNETVEKTYKNYCKFLEFFYFDNIYVRIMMINMLKRSSQLELNFSKHIELYNILN